MSHKPDQKLTETFLDAGQAPHFPLDGYRHGPLLFDQYDGVGASAVNQSIGYKAFVAFMAPEMFLALAAPGLVHDSRAYLTEGIRRYEGTDKFPLASPYLMVNFDHDPPKIIAHEGRNRMHAIRALGIEGDIPVVIYTGDKSADRLPSADVQRFFNAASSEEGQYIRGPVFSRAIVGNRAFTL
ncbi:MAG: hypothetical protein H6867_11280 [Rhodospirillales bacterium]|nr:hypothetical protein [Rhodospirillales bacterium]MCB9996711.1 hypothetical protein [Rhodospirillales bacterium]